MQEFIKHCQEQYAAGNPIMSNEEYDMVVKRFPEAETSIGVAGEVPHMFRMFSLDKKYPCRGDELPTNLGDYVKTPKLDGCAVDLLYINGKLQQCLTRGDGIKGKDRTANISQLVNNNLITFRQNHIVQITGEVLVSKEVANMRNYSSGAVNLDNPAEFAQRIKEGGLIFVAYGLQITDKYIGCEDWYGIDMSLLEDEGFLTVTTEGIKSMAATGQIPTDGIVYRLNSNNQFNKLGFTHKFPRASFAVKEDEPCTWTTIKEVVFQVGKSGKVTPVAIVEPITIEGASISRVTLNNVAYMQAMGITHIGQKVGLIRAGSIIPKVVEVEPYVE